MLTAPKRNDLRFRIGVFGNPLRLGLVITGENFQCHAHVHFGQNLGTQAKC
jgi:hypothetical protein